MAKKIYLTQGYVALVDDEDYERVSQFKWYASIGGGLVYAKHHIFKKGKRTTEFLHRYILNVTGKK